MRGLSHHGLLGVDVVRSTQSSSRTLVAAATTTRKRNCIRSIRLIRLVVGAATLVSIILPPVRAFPIRNLLQFDNLYTGCHEEQHQQQQQLQRRYIVTTKRHMAKSLVDVKRDEAWDEMFQRYLKCREKFGDEDGNIPSLQKIDRKLSNWVFHQRRNKRKGILKQERAERLELISFVWEGSRTITFEKNVQKLLRYKEEFGDCNVPKHYEMDPQLGIWVQTQRTSKDTLSKQKVSRLEDIGFVWSVDQGKFDEKIKQLILYKEEHGHCYVPTCGDTIENPELSRWVRYVRPQKGALSKEERKKLDELGFVWEGRTNQNKWNGMFDRLVQYQNEHGQCRKMKDFNKDSELRNWVSNQRRRFSRGDMPEDYKKKLNSVNFVWKEKDHSGSNTNDELWLNGFQKLVNYTKDNGHSNVPVIYEADPHLGHWVRRQRHQYKMGTLLQARIKRLEGIEFQWSVRDKQDEERWKTRYEEVKRYYNEHGSFKDMAKPEFKHLVYWLRKQRIMKADGRIKPEREALLEALGKDFSWSVNAINRSNRFKRDAQEP